MRSLKTALASAFAAAALSVTASAQLTEVTSQTSLGANDLINWNQLGPYNTSLTTGTNVVSSNGLITALSSPSNNFVTGQQSDSNDENGNYNGNFAIGAPLLFIEGGSLSFDLAFASPVSAAGLQLGINYVNTTFTAEITAFDTLDDNLGSFTENGITTQNADNSAIFLGIEDTNPQISKIEVTLVSPSYASLTAGNVSLADSVPEPGTIPLTGAAIVAAMSAALIARRRKTPLQNTCG